jgi:hypothetical protein
MKNFKLIWIFTLIFFSISHIITAQTVSTTYATQINSTFENLDKSRIPHKLLVDYAMEFAELSGYNGVLTNENIVNRGQFTSIYNTLLMSRVNTNMTGPKNQGLAAQDFSAFIEGGETSEIQFGYDFNKNAKKGNPNYGYYTKHGIKFDAALIIGIEFEALQKIHYHK